MDGPFKRRRGSLRMCATLLVLFSVVLAACGNQNASGPPGAESAPPGASGTDAAGGAAVEASPSANEEAVSGDTGDPNTISVWTYLDPEDPSVKAYIEQFQQKNPTITIKYTAYPEDNYQQKVQSALAAKSPPDVALIESRAWMKSGRVVELTPYYKQWGVDPNDFNPGGMARVAPEGKIEGGIYAIGDFLGGNVLFYNKALFDQAGVPYPSIDTSMTWQQYADMCRKLAKPDADPTKAIYGCTVPIWGFGIWTKWLWGEDGRQAQGNMNGPAMVEAWNLGTALVRDRVAPSSSVLETFPAGESDLFAQGRIAITWSDFTESSKYQEQNISFGLAPFYVPQGSESFVDTWTSTWGTFTESKHKDAALKFLQFIATDAQRIRMETSADPPLSTKVAQELGYGKDDPIKQQYFQVLQQAKAQVFVPTSLFPEGIWEREEVYRKLTTGEETDAKVLLDAEAEKAQPALDKAWQDWEQLGSSQ